MVLNLPTTGSATYVAKVSASNYTASPQNAFVGWGLLANADGSFVVTPGGYFEGLSAVVPPKSANFTVVGEAPGLYSYLVVWLPPGPASAPTNFIVSPTYNDGKYPDKSPYGSLVGFPFARWMNSVVNVFQSIIIHNRPTDSSAPYYPGAYQVGMTDGFSSPHANGLDSTNVSALVWKDGVIKARVDKGTTTCGDSKHWWLPLQIISPASGAATYVTPNPAANACVPKSDLPY